VHVRRQFVHLFTVSVKTAIKYPKEYPAVFTNSSAMEKR
jgi:hypothetical protein